MVKLQQPQLDLTQQTQLALQMMQAFFLMQQQQQQLQYNPQSEMGQESLEEEDQDDDNGVGEPNQDHQPPQEQHQAGPIPMDIEQQQDSMVDQIVEQEQQQ
jgi:hypothetical protein